MSKKSPLSNLGMVIILGSIWGLSETGLGLVLHKCASLASGSIMTGVALFFMAAAWIRSQHLLGPVLLVVIASIFKMFDALLLSLPIHHGAVANPIFAFLMEGLAFLVLVSLVKENLAKKIPGQALLGGLTALLAVNLFPLVKFVTGIPACVYPGTRFPLSLYYAPAAIGLAFITVPFGFWLAKKIEILEFQFASRTRSAALRYLITPATFILCLAIAVIIRLS